MYDICFSFPDFTLTLADRYLDRQILKADSSCRELRIFEVILHENDQWGLLKFAFPYPALVVFVVVAVGADLKQGPLIKCLWSSLINWQLTLEQPQGLVANPCTVKKSVYCYLCLKNKGIGKWLAQRQEAEAEQQLWIESGSNPSSTYCDLSVEQKLVPVPS